MMIRSPSFLEQLYIHTCMYVCARIYASFFFVDNRRIYVIVPFVFFSGSYSNSVLKLTPMYCITLFVNVLHSSINRE
jgi:hypothetical protein